MAAKTTVLKGRALIDGTGGKVLDDPVILIEDGRIRSVGRAGSVEEPRDAEVLDFSGSTLLPGLMDCHIHLAMFNCLTFNNYRVAQWEVTPELQQMYALFHAQICLEMGFTTLRDLGLNSSRGLLTEEMCAVRDAINAKLFAGPRLMVAGWTTITGSHLDLVLPRAALRPSFQTADGPYELRKLARTNLRIGCDVIKTCASGGGGTDKEEPDIRNMTQEELDAIVDEAHAFHKTCAVHCFTPDAQRMAVKAGTDTIEHMVFTDDDAIKRIIDTGIIVTPTLSHRTDHAIEVRRNIGTAEFVLRKMKAIQPSCYETFQRMYHAGVRIAMGTDMGYDPEMGMGAGELAIWAGLGMSPMDAIVATTRTPAQVMKLDKEIGTVERGKFADILAIDGDPLKDITLLSQKDRIQMVMKEGQVHVDRRVGHEKRVMSSEDNAWRIVDK
ncbi:MAG: amidohydrolase family protein [Acetobacteraceae bacterium]